MLQSQSLKARQFSSHLLKAVKQESAWIPIGRILAMLAGIVTVRVLTELVPPDQYGRLSLVTGFISLVSLTLYTSLGKSANRHVWDYVNQEQVSIWVSSVIWAFVFSGILFTLVLWGAIAFDVDLKILPQVAVWTIPIFLVAGALATTLLGMLNILHEHRVFVLGIVTYAWLKSGLAILVVLIQLPTAESIMQGYAISSALVLVGVLWIIWKRNLIQFSIKLPDLILSQRNMWLYATPFVFVNLFYWVQTTANRYVLDFNLGVEQVGVFVVAVAVARVPIQSVESIFGQIHQPILFQKIGQRNGQDVDILIRKQAFSQYILSFLTITLPVLGFTMLGANALIRLFAAPEYWIGTKVIPWVALAEFLRALTAASSMAFEVEHRPRSLIFPIAIASLITIVMTYFLSATWGITGAAIALTLGTLAWLVLTWLPASRLDCWLISWSSFFKVIFASILIVGFAWLVGSLVLNMGTITHSILFTLTFGLGYLLYAGRKLLG